MTLHLPLNDETRGVDRRRRDREDEGRRADSSTPPAASWSTRRRSSRRSSRAGSPAAAIDVFSKEPYSGPLLEAPNVVVTPHLAASTDEAQDRAGVIVAEQVAAALEGGLVTNAVNIPSVGAEDLEVLGAVPAARGEPRPVRARARARRAEPDHARVLRRARRARHPPAHGRGAERRVPRPGRPAGELRERAADRGRARDRGGRGARPRLARLHEPDRRLGGRRSRVAGTTIGRDNRQWLVSALGFEVEIELAPRMIFLRYDDVPGVIGRVGTLLGEAGVNIANMTVSRNREAGKAVMALSIDTPASPEVLARLGRGRRRRLLRHGVAAPATVDHSCTSPRSSAVVGARRGIEASGVSEVLAPGASFFGQTEGRSAW